MGFLSRFLKKRSKKNFESVGTVPTDKKEDFQQVIPAISTKDLLKDWSKTLEMIENHPLSQARVINTGILSDLTRILHSMDEKLSNLSKLDKIMRLLVETKTQLKEAGLSTKNIDAVLSDLKGLTVKDQEALAVFKEGEELTTESFATKAGLSRSTASSRLNKLFSLGLLEKKAEGKKIVYKKKTFNQ